MPNWPMSRVVVVLVIGGISAVFHRIFTQFRREIQQSEARIMAKLDNLTAEVAATRGAEQSAIVLLGELKQRLDDALASEDPAALQQLSDDLGAGRAALAAAVAANSAPVTAGGATSSAHPDNAPPPGAAPDEPTA